jgi:nitroimidazol reductase NimA-like FMN-containing flavoprotein (pyridoxamine 5'-phosphate oxidase superfamily)
MTNQEIVVPVASRPTVTEYGIPESSEGMLPWSFAESRLIDAKNYWVATVSPAGIPNSVPVWASWINGKIYFSVGETTRSARNLAKNPQISVNLESGDEVVYLKGKAEIIQNPDPELSRAIDDDFARKYNYRFSEQSQSPVGEGMFVVEPRVVIAWSKLPGDATSWHFNER